MAYSDKVLDHYENPRNVGKLDKTSTKVGTGMVGAPACGDVMQLQIEVEDGIITDAKFKTYGCFVGNTTVNTPTHGVKMRDLNVGDEVLAWNGVDVVPNKIKEIITRYVDIDDLLVVEFQRESHRKGMKPGTFKLICTTEHVFWNANNKPILAKDLVKGQELYEITEYDTLCVAIEDIDTAVEQVQNFVHNGMKIIDVRPIGNKNELRGTCRNDSGQVKVYDLKLEDGAHVYFTNRVGSHNCGSAIASSSLLTEWVKGMSLEQATEIKNSQIAEELALPPVKVHCSVLAEDAIKAAISDYQGKQQGVEIFDPKA